MTFNLTPISVILIITTLINIFTTTISWQRKKTKTGFYFAWSMIFITFWTFFAGCGYAATSISVKVFFAKLEYLSNQSAIVLFALASLSYAGFDKWLKHRWVKAIFIIIPVLNILLAWTNDLHGWVWVDFTWNPSINNVLIFHHGPGFLWVSLTSYIMISIILISLWTVARNGSILIKRQARMLLGATVFTLISNSIYLLNIPAIHGIDWSSVSFSITGLMFLVALYGSRFLDIVPIARHTIIDRMSDSFLVLDDQDRLVDFNQESQTIFHLNQDHLGNPITLVMANYPAIIDLVSHPKAETQIALTFDDARSIFDARFTLIKDQRGQEIGKSIILRNVTELYEAEKVLRLSEERKRLARDLHDSVNQSIHSLVLFSETLTAVLEKGNVERAIYISDRLQESARQSLKDVRLMLYQLNPSEADMKDFHLLDALEFRLNNVERRAGIQAELIREGSLENCPPEYHIPMFWITIEALNNALKHAQSQHIEVLIYCHPERTSLQVCDYGIGFRMDTIRAGGLGLPNMQERARLIGGELIITSEPDQGTSVSLTISHMPTVLFADTKMTKEL